MNNVRILLGIGKTLKEKSIFFPAPKSQRLKSAQLSLK
jgi:hypothetical protein